MCFFRAYACLMEPVVFVGETIKIIYRYTEFKKLEIEIISDNWPMYQMHFSSSVDQIDVI